MHLLALLLHAHVLDCGATLLGSKLICLGADLVHTGPSLPRRPHLAPCRTKCGFLVLNPLFAKLDVLERRLSAHGVASRPWCDVLLFPFRVGATRSCFLDA